MMLNRDTIHDAIAENLTSVYICTRVWSAWNYGTMTRDDFMDATDCDEFVESMIDSIETALKPPPGMKYLCVPEDWQAHPKEWTLF
jgi:hypothetical protein